MPRFSFAAGFACLLGLAACAQEDASMETPAPDPEMVETARMAAGALGERLKGRLVEAISTGGPVAAIDVCNLEAPEIASAVSAETGMRVGRTALRLRNPDNAPDAFERAGLESFQRQLEDGAAPSGLEIAEIVDGPDGKTLRYMKPIMTGGPCVLCHGTDVAPEVRAALLERYPDDEAVGFAPGDMRGAFTISKALAPRESE
ncbi:c-type heme family protein [Hyphococcus luteus]|uniref:Tll0287-like domain-containing protein n=1 Tax=Hyphococcus luteus TaxID=2058213 RepID=A0A2S7KAV4_9PROT|nr:DUF3365 domain-containing protein [Marinicaulis flavus]PQA89642.1 hypothetical protein CW354_01900 [Marinicaulis flavus]